MKKKKWGDALKGRLGLFTFRSRMIFTNTVVIVFSISLSTAVCLRIGRERAMENTARLSHTLIEQQLQNADYVLRGLEDDILQSYRVNGIPEHIPSSGAAGSRVQLENRANQMAYQRPIFDFVLIQGLEGEDTYRSTKHNWKITPRVEEQLARDRPLLLARKGKCVWRMIDGQLVAQRLLYRSSMLTPAGFILVGIDRDILYKQLHFDAPGNITSSALLQADGTLVVSSPQLGPEAWDTLLAGAAPRPGAYTSGWRRLGRENYFVQTEGLPKSGWAICSVIHERAFISDWDRVLAWGVLVAALSIAVALLFTIRTTLSMTRRVNKLIARADNIAEGRFYDDTPVEKDEFGLLACRLNTLGMQMDESIRRALAEANAKRELECQMLKTQYSAIQAQINPHFIYNSLETINSKALMCGQPEISTLICRFAQLFRFSVQKINREIRLREEMEYIERYLSFYSLAYPQKIAVSLDFPEELGELRLPSAILQPLVENAVVHAVEKSLTPVRVGVRCYARAGLLWAEVRDDGRGISPARLEHIRALLRGPAPGRAGNGGAPEGDEVHIGLYSVNRLIQLKYGGEYGLRISSTPGQGTLVQLCFPLPADGQAENEVINHNK